MSRSNHKNRLTKLGEVIATSTRKEKMKDDCLTPEAKRDETP
ncbi:uncharacterized protein G2W53_033928 [Senna tora]|uniref:Uncharacterized protein n=1 Tax=Senna tora TaxID=362788 RepID=A0A834T130_9FABA|nr:uncharacterized protein G2W53_033928 [Senna tora]